MFLSKLLKGRKPIKYAVLMALLWVAYFAFLLGFNILDCRAQINHSAQLIGHHMGGQGIIIGSSGVVSLFASLIESEKKYFLSEVKVNEDLHLLLDRSFDPGRGFGLSKRLGFATDFSVLLAGFHLQGRVVLSDRLLWVSGGLGVLFSALTLLLVFLIRFVYESRVRLASAAAQAALAKQVAHDIRSPLSALNLLAGHLKDLSEDKRMLIRHATQRINDIANSLLSRTHTNLSGNREKPSAIVTSNAKEILVYLPSLIDSLISEKRVEYQGTSAQIQLDLNEAYGLFVKVEAAEFGRVLSNLVNNAIEAIPKNVGQLLVTVSVQQNRAVIKLKDNGRGIPKEVLLELGEREISYGKEGTSSGSGIGVLHAKKTIKQFGGEIVIESTVGFGTTVEIGLPLQDAPEWFLKELTIRESSQIVVVDDDFAIHEIWKNRLHRLGPKTNLKSFSSLAAFKSWWLGNSEPKDGVLCLVDYEFLNERENGTNAIEELQIRQHAVLVTSRFEEPQIQNRCRDLGISLIPKTMVALIPMAMAEPPLPKQDSLRCRHQSLV